MVIATIRRQPNVRQSTTGRLRVSSHFTMSKWSKSSFALLAASLAASAFLHGQSAQTGGVPDAPSIAQNEAPPRNQSFNSPSAAANAGSSEMSVGIATPGVERSKPFLHRIVPAGAGPQDLTATQKFELSFRSRASFGAVGSSLIGAGEGQLFNSRPHYGTDSGAFGERLGAAELKQVTESFFSYGLFAAAFHKDPHYYRMGPGPGHGVAHRAVYSATRIVLTRDDDGNTGINWAKLAGMGSATALTNAYYPPQDRAFGQTMSAYGGSLATTVLTLELHEFVPDVFRAVRHRRQPTQ